jgi:hypothetical protein
MTKSRTLQQYADKSLTTGSQVQSTIFFPTEGDVIGLGIDLTANIGGTLTGAKAVTNAIQNLVISDKDGKTLVDVAGVDLPLLCLMLNGVGAYSTPQTATEDTDKTYRDVLGIQAKTKDQPLKMQVTFAPYSAMATSGADEGVVDLTFTSWYGVANATTRIYKVEKTLVAGDNRLGVEMPDGVPTNILAFSITDETKINSISFSANGKLGEDLSKVLPQAIISLEEDTLRDGHQTGIFKLPVEPFVSSIINSKFDLNMVETEDIDLFLISQQI